MPLLIDILPLLPLGPLEAIRKVMGDAAQGQEAPHRSPSGPDRFDPSRQTEAPQDSAGPGALASELELCHRRGLSQDNPILEHLKIESDLVPPEDADRARKIVADIADETRSRLTRKGLVRRVVGLESLSEQEKLRTVYEVMHDRGLRYKEMDRLIPGLLSSRLDCDTSSLVVLAVAHEMKWPVYGVRAPDHFFVRWEDGRGTRFNMDFGESKSDEDYQKDLSISEESIRRGVYLTNLSVRQMTGHAWRLHCTGKSDEGTNVDALASCDKAVDMDPTNIVAYAARAWPLRRLQMPSLAEADKEKILELDPNDFSSAMNQGVRLLKQGKYEEAYEAFVKANRSSPSDPEPFYYLGALFSDEKNYEDAVASFDSALELSRRNAEARVVSAFGGGLMPRDPVEAAVVDSEVDALEADIRIGRGNARADLGRHEDARKDYFAVIDGRAGAATKAKARFGLGVSLMMEAQEFRDKGQTGYAIYNSRWAIDYFKEAADQDPAIAERASEAVRRAQGFLDSVPQ
jgi:tetratricopeptide (TPR) repeat protein